MGNLLFITLAYIYICNKHINVFCIVLSKQKKIECFGTGFFFFFFFFGKGGRGEGEGEHR